MSRRRPFRCMAGLVASWFVLSTLAPAITVVHAHAIVYISPLFVEPIRNDAAVADGDSVEQNVTPSEPVTVTLSGEKPASTGRRKQVLARKTGP